MADEQQHFDNLIQIYRRRLNELQKKQAFKGINTEPEILMEIDDLEADIRRTEERRRRARAIGVDLFSYMELAPIDTRTIQLNWLDHFADGVAPAAVWAETLLPDLEQAYRRVGRNSPEPVAVLRQRATIACGLAFGWQFSNSSSVRLWIEQNSNDAPSEWWPGQEERATIQTVLLEEAEVASGTGDNTILEIGVSRDIRKSVAPFIAAQPFSLARHLRFTPDVGPGRSAVPDGAHALAMARQLGNAVVAAHTNNPNGMIHVFAAVPFALAVMIGRQLNACGLVQCYDLVKSTSSYAPACLLNAPAAPAPEAD